MSIYIYIYINEYEINTWKEISRKQAHYLYPVLCSMNTMCDDSPKLCKKRIVDGYIRIDLNTYHKMIIHAGRTVMLHLSRPVFALASLLSFSG